jgi:hypothetical protein
VYYLVKRILLRVAPDMYYAADYVGTWIHELSHLVFALLVFHKITSFKVRKSKYGTSSGEMGSKPLGCEHSGMLDSMMVSLGPLLVGTYGIFAIYHHYFLSMLTPTWQEYAISIGLSVIILTGTMPSRPDLKIILIDMGYSWFGNFRQLFLVVVIFVVSAWVYPALYTVNKTSVIPLYFLVLIYGGFLVDFLLLKLIHKVSF